MGWVYLGCAIVTEVVATLALKASEGFSRPIPAATVVIGYVTAFVLLGFALRSIPVGAAYATWSGVGTVGAAVGALVVFGERLRVTAIVGVAVVVVGVVLITWGGEAGG